MKYIVYNQGHIQDMVVLFNRVTDHDAMARNLGHNIEVVSAGFVHLSVNEHGSATPVCHGKSVSLNTKSRPEIDSKILASIFNAERSY